MSKKEKKMNNAIEDIVLDIPEEEIWTYKIEGMAAPHINKPYSKAGFKKLIFVIVILVAVGLSMYFSLNTATSETVEFSQREDGTYQFDKFNNTGDIKTLDIDFVSTIDVNYNYPVAEDGTVDRSKKNTTITVNKDESKPITSIREYALNCDGVVQVINIGADVTEIDGKSFYSCWALQRIEVDENNPNYCDVDGVLYNKDKTEIICVPCDHDTYRAEQANLAIYRLVDDGNGNMIEDENKTTRVDPDVWGLEIDGKVIAFDVFNSEGKKIDPSVKPEEFDSHEEIKVYRDKEQKDEITEIKVIAYRQKNFIDKLFEFFGAERTGSIKAYEAYDLEGNLLSTKIVGFRVADDICVPFPEGVTLETYTNAVWTYVIPTSVTTVGELAFNYANMTTVYLPEGLKTIETFGFYEIPLLANIYSYRADGEVTDTVYTDSEALGEVYLSLPEGLEEIGSDAFTQTAITYMYIPESVKKIGHHAFWATCYKDGDNIIGLAAIDTAASEDSFKKDVDTGDQWRPQYDYMLFNKSIDVNYSAQRKAM